MSVAVQFEPSRSTPPSVVYRWDTDTDILTARLHGARDGAGMSGSVELEGADGSWIILDVAGGAIDGLEVAVWPDVRKRSALAPPLADDVRVGSARDVRTVRLGSDLLLDVDPQSWIAGAWLRNVPPFPPS